MAEKIWGGRFKESINELFDSFNASISFDRRLYPQDIQGSMAHVKMLAKQKIISLEDASKIIDGLAEIRREMDRDKFPIDEDHEDIHSLVEKTLVEKIGPLGEKIHTGRSRNDQVALDVRMYVRDAISSMIELIKGVQKTLVDLAEANVEIIMPGYTHLQPAQPILLSHHLLAYYEMLKRDEQRFRDALKRVNILPLGSAALAGTTFNLDRQMVADELGFEKISDNSMDAVSDRDFVLEYLFDCSTVMMHLSRLSEELIIWSTREFGFLKLPEAFCTGSSIMPQKKNPDILELIRGKTGRVYGNLMSVLTIMKGLPLAYNKDMQEDKESLFDTVDTVENCLKVITLFLKEVLFDKDVMRNEAEKGYLAATDLADYLVTKGMTFRQAHETVGKIVLFAIDEGKELHELKLDDLKGFSRKITKDVFDWLDTVKVVGRRNLHGGTGPAMVKKSIKAAKREINS